MMPVFIVLIAFCGSQAHAFPEMVRMGYQNCTSCHVSPTGGGVQTPYGRSIDSEILSTWHFQGEEAIDHGLFSNKSGNPLTPDWLQFGGDSRWIQTYVNTMVAVQKQFFPMQNEIEGALKLGKLWIVGSGGVEGGPYGSSTVQGTIMSQRHYLMYNATDEVYIRAGKFMLPFGINQPNHTLVTQQGLNFGAERETYNFETGYIGEKFNFIITADFGRPDNSTLVYETGASVDIAYNLYDSHKIGWSVFSGTQFDSTRLVTGPYFILGFTKKLVLLSQADWQWKEFKDGITGEQRGLVADNKIQYEIIKGVHPYFLQQLGYLNTASSNSRFDSYGVGVMFYPRPHFEFDGEWDKQQDLSVASGYTDSAWLVLHYYL